MDRRKNLDNTNNGTGNTNNFVKYLKKAFDEIHQSDEGVTFEQVEEIFRTASGSEGVHSNQLNANIKRIIEQN